MGEESLDAQQMGHSAGQSGKLRISPANDSLQKSRKPPPIKSSLS
jgi:hypothetical protein